ncbi:MAG: type II secretion system protein [Planctomycetota bacterium]|nr:type II secretion system protein [Planctomycetota bacterium]
MRQPTRQTGFTLIELLVSIVIISILTAIVVPSLGQARRLARKSVCAVNLRATQLALSLYLEENDGNFFPYQLPQADGVLWYWGFEQTGGGTGEGDRPIDESQARLAPYVCQPGKTTNCPSLTRDYPFLKPKFATAGYGFAINRMMLAGGNPSRRLGDITQPSATVAWADSVQINIWQAPASATNPLLEEWYYLDNRLGLPATFHFRHLYSCNAAFADGAVCPLASVWLDVRCDGLVGRPEAAVPPSEVTPLLKLDK